MKDVVYFVIYFSLPMMFCLLNAHSHSSVQGDASITVMEPLVIEGEKDLDFGAVEIGRGPGSVSTSDEGAAVFNIKGPSSSAFQVVLPAEHSVLMIGPEGRAIAIESFHSDLSSGQAVLNEQGEFELRVGATHGDIHEETLPGHYQGTFTVEISY